MEHPERIDEGGAINSLPAHSTAQQYSPSTSRGGKIWEGLHGVRRGARAPSQEMECEAELCGAELFIPEASL